MNNTCKDTKYRKQYTVALVLSAILLASTQTMYPVLQADAVQKDTTTDGPTVIGDEQVIETGIKEELPKEERKNLDDALPGDPNSGGSFPGSDGSSSSISKGIGNIKEAPSIPGVNVECPSDDCSEMGTKKSNKFQQCQKDPSEGGCQYQSSRVCFSERDCNMAIEEGYKVVLEKSNGHKVMCHRDYPFVTIDGEKCFNLN